MEADPLKVLKWPRAFYAKGRPKPHTVLLICCMNWWTRAFYPSFSVTVALFAALLFIAFMAHINEPDGFVYHSVFWKTASWKARGWNFILILLFIPSLFVPLVYNLSTKSLKYRNARPAISHLKLILMPVLLITSGAMLYYLLPMLTVKYSSFSLLLRMSWYWLVSPVILGLVIEGLAEFGKRQFLDTRRKNKMISLPELADFSYLRPLLTNQLNLDTGALPTVLSYTGLSLIRWRRLLNRQAGTSIRFKTDAFSYVHILRERLAALMNVPVADVVFTINTTNALMISLQAIKAKKIAYTEVEHPTVKMAINSFALCHNAEVQEIAIRELTDVSLDSDEAIIERWMSAFVQHQPDVAVVSHVCYLDGRIVPIGRITEASLSYKGDVKFIIDGAHAVGQLVISDIRVNMSRIAFYMFSGHKWLYGPPALGILVAGSTAKSEQEIKRLKCQLHEAYATTEAQRGESPQSSISLDSIVGLLSSLGILYEDDEIDSIANNLAAIRSHFIGLARLRDCIQVLQQNDRNTGAGTINLQRKPVATFDQLRVIKERLDAKFGVVCSLMEWPASLRFTLPFYLNRTDIEYIVSSVERAFTSRI